MSHRLTHHYECNMSNSPACQDDAFRAVEFRPHARTVGRKAFTLVELMVVIGLIVLVVATALPTISGLFSAGADRQAYNLLAAQCAAARALAIQKSTYAAVHVQLSNRDDLEGCYGAVMLYNTTSSVFELSADHEPQQYPGSYAFGQIPGGLSPTAQFLDSSSGDYQNLGSYWFDFTTFTIVFDSTGQVVLYPNMQTIAFQQDDLFGSSQSAVDGSETRLWILPPAEPGTAAVTLFDFNVLNALDASGREAQLNEGGQFMALNYYTGQFFFRY